MKNTRDKPKLLVIRPRRDTCKAFYKKFKLFEVDYLDIGNTNNLLPKFIKGLESRIRRADVVCISDNYYFYNLQAVLIANKYKKPIVTILWCTIPNHISSWLFPYSLITKIVVKSTNLFILRNNSSLDFAKSLKIPNSKIKVIYKGVDLKHFYPKEIKKDSNLITVLYVGKLIKSKGIYDLIDACKKIKDEGINIKLIMAGSGRLGEFVNYEKLGELYRKADIFCAPSKSINFFNLKIWEEYFSYVLMEAQASGLPIVTSKTRGILEEVDHRNEFIEIGNKEELYFSIKKLILDKNKRLILGNINRKRAERLFDANIQSYKTEQEILKYVKK